MYVSISRSATKKYPTELHFRPLASWSDLARVIVSQVWSPIAFKGGYRRGSGFERCQLAALDIDDGMELSEALRWLRSAHVGHVVATTKSHQLAKEGEAPRDRFRVVMMWASEITEARVYQHNIKRLAKAWGGDPAATDLARIYQPGREIVQVLSGKLMPVDIPKPVSEISRQITMAYSRRFRSGRSEKAFARAFIEHGNLDNTGGRKRTIYSVACELVKAGWKDQDIRTAITSAPISWAGLEMRIVDDSLTSARRRFG